MEYDNPLESALLRFGKIAGAGTIIVIFQILLAAFQVLQTDPNFIIYGAEITLIIAVILSIQKYFKEKAK